MFVFDLKLLRFAAILTVLVPVSPAWALLIVESSDAPGIKVDAEFEDAHVFDVPAGATIKLTKTPGRNGSDETHTIRGRFRGTLGDYVRQECWRPDANCGDGDVRGGVPGGTKGMQPREGGVRAIEPTE